MWELYDYSDFASQVKRIERKVDSGIPLSSQEGHLDRLYFAAMPHNIREKFNIATWVMDERGDGDIIMAVLAEVLGLPVADMRYEWRERDIHFSSAIGGSQWAYHPLASQIRAQTRRRIPGPYGHSTTKRWGHSSEFTDIRYGGKRQLHRFM